MALFGHHFALIGLPGVAAEAVPQLGRALEGWGFDGAKVDGETGGRRLEGHQFLRGGASMRGLRRRAQEILRKRGMRMFEFLEFRDEDAGVADAGTVKKIARPWAVLGQERLRAR